MSLQSTAVLDTSPLHVRSSDGSLLEETSRSPTFRLLMRLSFRSCLVISHSLCYALRAARRLSAVTLFRLKIASSGRGALARTRCAHLNCKRRRRRARSVSKLPKKAGFAIESANQPKLIEKTVTYQFLSPLVGKHLKQSRRRP
jgi:hypothetical protein